MMLCAARRPLRRWNAARTTGEQSGCRRETLNLALAGPAQDPAAPKSAWTLDGRFEGREGEAVRSRARLHYSSL